MKKLLAFDLDGTLAESKSALTVRMARLLAQLLEAYHICVISGGKFGQFEKQLLTNLKTEPDKLEKLHIMPTCGTRYYTYSIANNSWVQIYAEDFTETQKAKIINAIEKAIEDLGYRPAQSWGDLIEDRGSQITYSALGQEAPVKDKEEWDQDNSKKNKLRSYIADLIPEFEVRCGGTTSIDVTKTGVDKAYGMKKLMEHTGLKKEEILFFGDKLGQDGNDYPVKAMGIDSLEVSSHEDTALILEAILHIL